eukprot:TRINITY_DN2404_c0_g1_i1.p1 TRINITY_DN2404_c0_g1~~TRINITY_DN2404_c0_g1_i1.p1  ORF type:complete len:552 (+),score=51.29 TRINITY_DN2404_c0_g1_i1:904-2559(+)
MSLVNVKNEDLFGELFYVFSTQGTFSSIIAEGYSGQFSTNITVQYNTFNNSQGLYIERVENITVRNNYYVEIYSSPITISNCRSVDFYSNVMINISSAIESGSSNRNISIHHNILYSSDDFRPHMFYYFYIGNYSAPYINDDMISMKYNILWGCSIGYCKIINNNTGIYWNTLDFSNNIIRLGENQLNLFNPISVNHSHNLIIGTEYFIGHADYLLDSYCSPNSSSLCINYQPADVVFRNPGNNNFGISPCFIKALEFNSNYTQYYYLSALDWNGRGYGSSRLWLSEVDDQYVGPFHPNVNPGRNVPFSYEPGIVYNTVYTSYCKSCFQVNRSYTQYFYIDSNTCEVSTYVDSCSTCNDGSLNNGTFVIYQTETIVKSLEITNSSVTYNGNVTLSDMSSLTLSYSTLNIIGSFSLSPQSNLTITKDTSIVISGDAKFSGVLIVDYRNLSQSEYDTVVSSPKVIATYSNLANKFTSVEVLKPKIIATTGGMNVDQVTFSLNYLPDRILLVSSFKETSSSSSSSVRYLGLAPSFGYLLIGYIICWMYHSIVNS